MSNWKLIGVEMLGLPANLVVALQSATPAIETIEQIELCEDLTKIDGIGIPSAKQINAAIEKAKADLSDEGGSDGEGESAPLEINSDDDGEQPPSPSTDDEDEPQLDREGLEPDFLEMNDAEARQMYLDKCKSEIASASDDKLYAMVTKAKQSNDYEITQLLRIELDNRHEVRRSTQIPINVELRFNDLNRAGMNSPVNISTYVKRHRLSHPASVALAKLYLAMVDSGEKLESGRPITQRSHVICKVLETAYAQMKAAESE